MTRNNNSDPIEWDVNAHYNPVSANDAAAIAEPIERSGYRRSRGADPVATIGALAIGLATVAAFAFMNPTFVKQDKRDVTVVALLEMPEDPPAEAPPPPPEQSVPPPKAAIVAPVPLVAIPQAPVMQAPPVAAPVASPAPPPKPVALAVTPRGPENVGELSAKMISAKPPRYPFDSRRQHEQGTVILSVLLSVDGRVADVSIARSSGFPRLDDAALDAVRNWRWSPMMRDGSAVMVRGMVTIPFILQGGERGGRGGHGGRRHDGDDRGRDGRGGLDRDGDRGPGVEGDTV
jgi:protein TonB